jgi:hypothetical protein
VRRQGRFGLLNPATIGEEKRPQFQMSTGAHDAHDFAATLLRE